MKTIMFWKLSLPMESLIFTFILQLNDIMLHYSQQEASQHDVRYQGKSILASKDTPLLMNKWKSYLVNLWQCHFDHSLDFLSYFSSVRRNPAMVRDQMLENSFLLNNAPNKLDTIVPIIPMIGSLAKAKFCNAVGHPIKWIQNFFQEFFTKVGGFISLLFPRASFALRRLYSG
ncbi:hypothetical protein RGQ29_001084 [Quercus rubra]|uniref:Maturase MatK N-terminal domain-containing protein n=1 Tax=Quercus rubra TaxID=3512 RepID=A0AAN7JDQ5_QUERU|nr:hypothetical protein RGQ29_001084 [Quercus rubra]